MSNFTQGNRGFRGGFSAQGAPRFTGQQQQHHQQYREDGIRSGGPGFRGGRPVGMMGQSPFRGMAGPARGGMGPSRGGMAGLFRGSMGRGGNFGGSSRPSDGLRERQGGPSSGMFPPR